MAIPILDVLPSPMCQSIHGKPWLRTACSQPLFIHTSCKHSSTYASSCLLSATQINSEGQFPHIIPLLAFPFIPIPATKDHMPGRMSLLPLNFFQSNMKYRKYHEELMARCSPDQRRSEDYRPTSYKKCFKNMDLIFQSILK